jgi:hypothetical protein
LSALEYEQSGAKVVSKKSRRKLNKVVTIMFLPVFIFVFLVGLLFYGVDNRKRNSEPQHKQIRKDSLTLIPAIFGEKQEIPNE